MKITRIDLQGACEPMEFKSKKALREYLIDFHLQDYHKDNKEDWKDIKLIKSFTLSTDTPRVLLRLSIFLEYGCSPSLELLLT